MSNRKEEILKESYETVFSVQKYDSKCPSKGVCDLFALPAMDIFAKEVAIEFADFINKEAGYHGIDEDGNWWQVNGNNINTEQLYELFLQSKKQ